MELRKIVMACLPLLLLTLTSSWSKPHGIRFLSLQVVKNIFYSLWISKWLHFPLLSKHKSELLKLSPVQLGQPSVNPPRLVLEVGGTSTLQAVCL